MGSQTALPKLLRPTDPGLPEQFQALPVSVARIVLSTDGLAIAAGIDAAPDILVCDGTGSDSRTNLRALSAR
ncbi:hypothetical protein [Streptomyces naphthomycinicus]|uniref:hypothetical protein n=1 Tax=Streptomyces naphthomycinicus TaxID=2872625 RepID=UPI001CEDB6C7|nr:hypothetical protein [Streptomyces sp. TML10]